MSDNDVIKWLLWAIPICSFVVWIVTYFSLKIRLYNLQDEFNNFVYRSRMLSPVKIEQVLQDKSGQYLIVYRDEIQSGSLFTIYLSGEQFDKFKLKVGQVYWNNMAGWFQVPSN